MAKNRGFLMGLGLGIIIGALLFQLMLSRDESTLAITATNEIVATDSGNETVLEESLDESKQEVAEPQHTESVTAEPTDAAVQPAATPEPSPSDQALPSATAEAGAAAFVLRIKPGMNLTDTAELLAARKVIPSGNAFIQQMNKQKKVVRAGLFLLKENMTVAEAIQIVTTQPLTREQAEMIAGGPIE
jgi:hypothetical protein